MGQRIYYLRDQRNITKRADGSLTRGNPKICIVSQFNPKTGEVEYGLSSTHPKDNFNKNLARQIAADRMKCNHLVEENKEEVKSSSENKKKSLPKYGCFTTKASTGFEINRAVIEHIAENFMNSSTQIRTLTLLWLEKNTSRHKSSSDTAKSSYATLNA